MRIVLAIATLLLVPALAFAAPTSDFAKMGQHWADDWNAKKLDVVMAYYAPDPVFLAGNGERWEGAAIMRKNFAGLLDQFSADLHLHSIKSEASGNLSYDSGTFAEKLTPKTGAAFQATGNYLFIFRHEKAAGWKLLEQTFTPYAAAKP